MDGSAPGPPRHLTKYVSGARGRIASSCPLLIIISLVQVTQSPAAKNGSFAKSRLWHDRSRNGRFAKHRIICMRSSCMPPTSWGRFHWKKTMEMGNQTLGSARGANMSQETLIGLNSPVNSNVRMHSPPSETDGGGFSPNVCRSRARRSGARAFGERSEQPGYHRQRDAAPPPPRVLIQGL